MKGRRTPTAVVLVNLGTPAQLTTRAIRSFLRDFLGDGRVVEIPRPIWWLILRLFILPLRPRKLMHTYGAIWTAQGSPMTVITRAQVEKLQAALDLRLETEVKVVYAMTYGEPHIAEVIDDLYQTGHRRLVVLPLYPQYSGSTTAAVFDQVAAYIQKRRALPGLSLINAYFYQPAYIEALHASIESFWKQHGRAEHLLFSYHGIPQSYVDKGDPYPGHCECTTAAAVEALGLAADQYSMAYQSRFGRAAWLQPYTSERVVELARSGVRHLDVVCPAFAADCLETLEEIAVENRDLFIANGGTSLRLIPCLNDSQWHIEALTEILLPHLRAIG